MKTAIKTRTMMNWHGRVLDGLLGLMTNKDSKEFKKNRDLDVTWRFLPPDRWFLPVALTVWLCSTSSHSLFLSRKTESIADKTCVSDGSIFAKRKSSASHSSWKKLLFEYIMIFTIIIIFQNIDIIVNINIIINILNHHDYFDCHQNER